MNTARDLLHALLHATRSPEGRVDVSEEDRATLDTVDGPARTLALPFALERTPAALRLLGGASSGRVLELLQAALDDDDVEIRDAAVEALSRSAGDDRFTIAAILHRRPDVRARALARWRGNLWPGARAVLLADPETEVAARAALVRAPSPAELPFLLERPDLIDVELLEALPAPAFYALLDAALANERTALVERAVPRAFRAAPSLLARLGDEARRSLAEVASARDEDSAGRSLILLVGATDRGALDAEIVREALSLAESTRRGVAPGIVLELAARLKRSNAGVLLDLVHLDGGERFVTLEAIGLDAVPAELAGTLFARAPESADDLAARDRLFARLLDEAEGSDRAALALRARSGAILAWLRTAGDEARLALLERALERDDARPEIGTALAAALDDASLRRAVELLLEVSPARGARLGVLPDLARRMGPEAFAAVAEGDLLLPRARAAGLGARFLRALRVVERPPEVPVRELTDEEAERIRACPGYELDLALKPVIRARVRGVARAILERARVPRSNEVAARIALACDPEADARRAFQRAFDSSERGELRRELLRLSRDHPGPGVLTRALLDEVDDPTPVAAPRARGPEPTRALIERAAGHEIEAAREATARLCERPGADALVAAALLGGGCAHPRAVIEACPPEVQLALLERARELPDGPARALVALVDATLPDPRALGLARSLAERRPVPLEALRAWCRRGADASELAAATLSQGDPSTAAALLLDAGDEEALREIPLDEVEPDLRFELALRRARAYDSRGLPELLGGLPGSDRGGLAADAITQLGSRVVSHVIEATLLAGPDAIPHFTITRLIERQPDEERAALVARALTEADDPVLLQQLSAQLRPEDRAEALSTVARVFAEGTRASLRLVGRRLRIRMTAEALGFARLSRGEIFVNPLPAFRARHGVDVVRGLIFHELGHHRYHADAAALRVWDDAAAAGEHALLNLVADEHLERRLRAEDPEIGDTLKRTAAWVFRHAPIEFEPRALLDVVGTAGALGIGRMGGLTPTPRGMRTRSGAILALLESRAHQDLRAFSRFVRCLRLGQGSAPSDDPRIAEALARFKGKSFRKLEMPGLLALARELKALFGDGVRALELLDLHEIAGSSDEELSRATGGLTDDEVQDAVRRALDGRGTRTTASPTLNRGSDTSFPGIDEVVPVPFDPAAHRALARTVSRPARALRRALESLGLNRAVAARRSRGHAVDRARLQRALLTRDPRLLRARPRGPRADLFLGVLVDCSSSMLSDDRIARARAFAALIAEAARDLPGVDARFVGFTDRALYDAGDARRCAAAGLTAEGGNNDAAALAWLARAAERSPRSGRLLVMISDGAPSECTTAALSNLVERLGRRHLACAQIALRPLDEVCFPHYVEVQDPDDDLALRRFAAISARLVRRTLRP